MIKTKKDIESMVEEFNTLAEYDNSGKKHYFVFADNERSGEWTMMKYADGIFTLHGRGEDYCDVGEKIMEIAELKKFIWFNRKAVNESMKKTLQNA